jgi:FkbM family methyltransferase
MSNINLQWIVDNFSKTSAVIYDIGCADLCGDSAAFKSVLPDATIHAFECAEVWRQHNQSYAPILNLNYHHIAVSDNCDGVVFYPSIKNKDQQWPWSGSIYYPNDYLSSVGLKFGEGYFVPSTTLTEFCKNNTTPDFIHIDAQGAEYAIFKNMTIKPKAIWAEISEFHLYDTAVTYPQFNEMMLNYGYIQKYLDNHDTLYVRDDINLTEYIDK